MLFEHHYCTIECDCCGAEIEEEDYQTVAIYIFTKSEEVSEDNEEENIYAKPDLCPYCLDRFKEINKLNFTDGGFKMLCDFLVPNAVHKNWIGSEHIDKAK
jgi:hypothetical protein